MGLGGPNVPASSLTSSNSPRRQNGSSSGSTGRSGHFYCSAPTPSFGLTTADSPSPTALCAGPSIGEFTEPSCGTATVSRPYARFLMTPNTSSAGPGTPMRSGAAKLRPSHANSMGLLSCAFAGNLKSTDGYEAPFGRSRLTEGRRGRSYASVALISRNGGSPSRCGAAARTASVGAGSSQLERAKPWSKTAVT